MTFSDIFGGASHSSARADIHERPRLLALITTVKSWWHLEDNLSQMYVIFSSTVSYERIINDALFFDSPTFP